MSATEEKIAHEKWVREHNKMRQYKRFYEIRFKLSWIKSGTYTVSYDRPENSFKRLQLI